MSVKKLVYVALICYASAIFVFLAEKRTYPLLLQEAPRYAPNLTISEIFALDHRGFLADLYFIQVNIHSGSLVWKPLRFQFDSQWAYQVMDVVTDLDPKFYTAYLLTGMGLIHDFDDILLARPIMEKGMKVFPESWEIPFWLGYGFYIYQEDYETAGRYLWEASRKPGAPRSFLAVMLSALENVGDYDKAVWAMTALVEEAKNPGERIVLTKKLVRLKNLAGLQKAAEIYRDKFGRWPLSLEDLVVGGILKALPGDPSGKTYVWDREKNLVVLKKEKKKKPGRP